jgi:putative SOS response-associated peptidase YedK
MCGRFTLTLEISALQMAFDLGAQTVDWKGHFNLAPSMLIPLLTNQQPERIQFFQWGLVPAWAKDPAIGSKLINARSETVQEKPSFRTAFKSRRCLILADGFYEWQKAEAAKGGNKIPYYFQKKDHSPFYFAGLWESWVSKDDQNPLQTCTILTCEANAVVKPIHERMPVIFDNEKGHAWLRSGQSAADLQSMLTTAADGFLRSYAVSSLVNSPANNSAACIDPLTRT